MFKNYSEIPPREDIGLIVILILSFLLIAYVVHLICLCYKTDAQVIERCDFSERYNIILNKIIEVETIEDLEAIRTYATIFLPDKDFFDNNSLGDLSLLNEHFRLRELQLTDQIEEASLVADSIEQRLQKKAAFYEALRSYN